MIFNSHSALVVAGSHAFLSPSKYHWIGYDEDKLDRVYTAYQAGRRGTELHALAHDLIRLRVKLEEKPITLNMYVNDAIGFRMVSEQILFYSINCYGTADTISFRNNVLRIHDLKTGAHDASEKQLEVYAALFCLEYRMKPFTIEIDLKIYQNDEVQHYIPDPDEITHIMEKIKAFDKRIELLKEEVL